MARILFASIALLALTASGAFAQESSETAAVPAQAPSPGAGAPLGNGEMASINGGESIRVEVLTRQQLTGSTSGNSITAGSVTSGEINFSSEALNGFSGVGNFVVNTGANNTLQGGINISIVTAPQP